MFIKCYSSGIQIKSDFPFQGVAAVAGVNKVFVIKPAIRIFGLRHKMIRSERCGPIRIPAFPLEAIDASECEVVPQKRLVASVDRKSTRLNSSHLGISY